MRPRPLSYAERIAQNKPVDPQARARTLAFIKSLASHVQKEPYLVSPREGGQPATPPLATPPSPLRTPAEEVLERARALIAEGTCSTLDTAVQTVLSTDTDLYHRWALSNREHADARRANAASDNALKVINDETKKLQFEHADWTYTKALDELFKDRPDLYQAYVEARGMTNPSSAHFEGHDPVATDGVGWSPQRALEQWPKR